MCYAICDRTGCDAAIEVVREKGAAVMGRPSIFSEEIAAAIVDRIMEGRSLRSICKEDDMPGISTVIRWLADDRSEQFRAFRAQYEAAKREQADVLADEIVEIADDGSNDWMARHDPENPGYIANGEHIQRSRLRCDVRKWVASKLKPKRYGEHLDLTSDGRQIEMPSIIYLVAESSE